MFDDQEAKTGIDRDSKLVLVLRPAMESRVVRTIVIAFTFLGYGWNWFALAPLALFPSLYPAVSRLGGALITVWTIIMIGKLAWRRKRPYLVLNLHTWWGAPTSASFPSGHATGAFAVTTFLTVWLASKQVAHVAWIVGPLWILASGVAASRVFLALHYVSDVVAGALLGIAAGVIGARW